MSIDAKELLLDIHTIASGHAYGTIREMAQAAGGLDGVLALVREAGFPRELLMNLYPDRLRAFLDQKHSQIGED